MKLKEAFELSRKLNPPLEAKKPMPYGVCRIGKEYFVVHLPTKKIVEEMDGKEITSQ